MSVEVMQFIIVLVAITLIFVIKMVRIKIEAQGKGTPSRTQWNELATRLDSLEKRMSNIETIVVATNKSREFDKL